MAASTNPAPWDRYGWVMAVIWLFFLGFPILEAVESSGWDRIGGLTALGVFITTYIFGFVRFPRSQPSQATQNLAYGLLVGAAGLGALTLGLVALTFLPFITAFGMYFQPPRRSIVLAAFWFALTATAVAISGKWSLYGIVVAIVFLVAVVTFLPRWLDSQQQAHLALRAEFERVAEQERVARDVHDVLGHSLTVIAVKAELAGRLLEKERSTAALSEGKILDGAATEIAAIESLSRQALSEIRATVAGLRVTRLGEELENAREAAASAGLVLEVAGEVEDLDPRHRLVAGWVVREAITNVIRHAGARTCRIAIGANTVAIVDDGCGVRQGDSGSGISGMRERVAMSGGRLEISGEPDSGTRLEVSW